MAMNFFEQQDAARRNTGRLVFLFALSVALTIAAIYLLIAVAIVAGHDRAGHAEPHVPRAMAERDPSLVETPSLWNWPVLLGVSVVVLAVVGFGSVYKIAQLGSGGPAVAEMIGGKLLHHDTRDPNAQKILNVVEEMAIASGTPVPPVYLVDEPGINAFAAGYSSGDAVIGVTRGCIERLSRDELQGVVAHEFSHILNGDMRLNIRLIGLIHGILVVGLIGYYVMRAGMATSRSSGNKKGADPGMAMVVFGAGVMAIGFIGTLFGQLIRAAVSRQREFLADASAVQFTRNPHGIAGALQKIGGHPSGAHINHSHASEIAHMMFSQSLAGMFATHPPLVDRIRRVDPNWDGQFVKPGSVDNRNEVENRGAAAVASQQDKGRERIEGLAKAAMAVTAMQMIGQPTPAHVTYARELIAGIPADLREAAHEPYGARALIYAMLLHGEGSARLAQIQCLSQREEAEVGRIVSRLAPSLGRLDTRARLPLIELASASLGELSERQYDRFRENIRAFMEADGSIDTFEWVLGHVLLHHLDQHFDKRNRPRVQYYALSALGPQLSTLLSALAHVGHENAGEVAKAFAAGAAQLSVEVSLLPERESDLGGLDAALDVLDTVAAKQKQKILMACAACIAADKAITTEEAEVFRAVASSLDCPTPPILPGQPLV